MSTSDRSLQPVPETVNPFDGFHAFNREISGDKREIWVEVMGAGQPVEAHVVATFDDDTKGRGEAERLHQLMQAICRYMNAGGDAVDLTVALSDMAALLMKYQIEFPPGWSLLNCLQQVDDPTIVLTHPETGRAMVVVEDNYCEIMSMEELGNSIRG